MYTKTSNKSPGKNSAFVEISPEKEPSSTDEPLHPPGPDRLFADPLEHVADFDFDGKTAAVFDDMLNRSVPFYGEIQRIIGEIAADFACDGSQIFDLGCSTCNSFLAIDHFLSNESSVRFVGIDSSEDMLEKARQKIAHAEFARDYELRLADLNKGVHIENASVVLMVLTLQFVRPLYRTRLISDIYNGLNDNGCLILVEKVLGDSSTFNRLFIKHYYELKKRKGYSELEISQKREALENILVPYRLEENKELLQSCGFQDIEILFKWYNFCAMIAQKQPGEKRPQ
ncbi:MAG: carboxy-S-adenosyl-L-methionine synthase CmoA [Sedimentisphaerales bacterium]|jgi:tRNA (cmo5U34)-methyltransferase